LASPNSGRASNSRADSLTAGTEPATIGHESRVQEHVPAAGHVRLATDLLDPEVRGPESAGVRPPPPSASRRFRPAAVGRAAVLTLAVSATVLGLGLQHSGTAAPARAAAPTPSTG